MYFYVDIWNENNIPYETVEIRQAHFAGGGDLLARVVMFPSQNLSTEN